MTEPAFKIPVPPAAAEVLIDNFVIAAVKKVVKDFGYDPERQVVVNWDGHQFCINIPEMPEETKAAMARAIAEALGN